METFQWLLQVTHGLSSIQPHGEGHASTIRVRLLHASVRQRIMKLVQSRPEYFNVEKYGVPVNTLDSIHSITTFCCNPMWLQLPLMGITPRQQEVDDYIALFRYIAYLLATPAEYFETTEKAKAVMESMYLHELELTQTSKIVGYNFVKCLEDLPPMNISKEFIEAGSRWFNGHEPCDALDLGRPGWYHYTLMIGLNWIVVALAFVQRRIPAFDRFMIRVRPSQICCPWSRMADETKALPRLPVQYRHPKQVRPRSADGIRLQIRAAAQQEHGKGGCAFATRTRQTEAAKQAGRAIPITGVLDRMRVHSRRLGAERLCWHLRVEECGSNEILRSRLVH